MARSRSSLAPLAMAAIAAWALLAPMNFVNAPPRAGVQFDTNVAVAVAGGLAPLAATQSASAYDSVVAMLQSWMVGGTVLAIIMGACLVAATANPLTKRRQEAMRLAREAAGKP
eukprot:TRINITY_DN36585_c0_g2_i1.p1 TRINITY_DN36585_c0_g2~~TRINITY_DN36585_c0_g2_i1.p1  ORF type:complete len:114 (-),score=28.46 TRINITY_DN36585_c0_g2_i1:96-437(-)